MASVSRTSLGFAKEVSGMRQRWAIFQKVLAVNDRDTERSFERIWRLDQNPR